jgi:hypothetical protein
MNSYINNATYSKDCIQIVYSLHSNNTDVYRCLMDNDERMNHTKIMFQYSILVQRNTYTRYMSNEPRADKQVKQMSDATTLFLLP